MVFLGEVFNQGETDEGGAETDSFSLSGIRVRTVSLQLTQQRAAKARNNIANAKMGMM